MCVCVCVCVCIVFRITFSMQPELIFQKEAILRFEG